jgi:hypothetical protein
MAFPVGFSVSFDRVNVLRVESKGGTKGGIGLQQQRRHCEVTRARVISHASLPSFFFCLAGSVRALHRCVKLFRIEHNRTPEEMPRSGRVAFDRTAKET